MLPPVLPLRLLETCYDGPVPDELITLSQAETYAHYHNRLLQAAERRFHVRLLDSLQLLAAWRMRPSPWCWYRLQIHSESVQFYRHRAREAFDLLA